MALDLVRVDQNLQIIRQIEGSWSLPKLPDQVKLDLAGNTIMTPPALTGLLGGVEEQLQEANRRMSLPTRDTVGAGDVLPAKPRIEPIGKTEIGRVIAGITGQERPQVLDPLATRRLK